MLRFFFIPLEKYPFNDEMPLKFRFHTKREAKTDKHIYLGADEHINFSESVRKNYDMCLGVHPGKDKCERGDIKKY